MTCCKTYTHPNTAGLSATPGVKMQMEQRSAASLQGQTQPAKASKQTTKLKLQINHYCPWPSYTVTFEETKTKLLHTKSTQNRKRLVKGRSTLVASVLRPESKIMKIRRPKEFLAKSIIENRQVGTQGWMCRHQAPNKCWPVVELGSLLAVYIEA